MAGEHHRQVEAPKYPNKPGQMDTPVHNLGPMSRTQHEFFRIDSTEYFGVARELGQGAHAGIYDRIPSDMNSSQNVF